MSEKDEDLDELIQLKLSKKQPPKKVTKKDVKKFLLIVGFIIILFGLNLYSLLHQSEVKPLFNVDNNIVIRTPKYSLYTLEVRDLGNMYDSIATVSYAQSDIIEIPKTYELQILSHNQIIKKGDVLATQGTTEIKSPKDGRITAIDYLTSTFNYILTIDYLDNSTAVINISNDLIIQEDLTKQLDLNVSLSYQSAETTSQTIYLSYQTLTYNLTTARSLIIYCKGLTEQLVPGYTLKATITFIQKKSTLGIDKRCVEHIYLNKIYVRKIVYEGLKTINTLEYLTLVADYGDYYEVSDTEKIGSTYFLNPNKSY